LGLANSNSERPSQPDKSGNAGASANNGSTYNGRYRINAGQSQITAQVGVGGLFSALGHDHTVAAKGLNGEVHLTAGTIEPASLSMTLKAGSLAEIGKQFSDKDRQGVDRAIHEEALESTKYPEITFQ
jgi:hypothetical protein